MDTTADYLLTDIDWDTGEETPDLEPTLIVAVMLDEETNELDVEDVLTSQLSDWTGWLHNGWADLRLAGATDFQRFPRLTWGRFRYPDGSERDASGYDLEVEVERGP